MHERLEFQDASSHKFWEVTVAGREMTVSFGRVGAKGQRKSKTLASSAAARAEAGALIAEKLKKGYRRGGAEGASAPAPEPDVAAARLPEPLRALIGQACFVVRDGEEDGVVVFDWSAIPRAAQDEFLDDLFGDCRRDDFPALLVIDDEGTRWRSSACVPFALVGVERGTTSFAGGDSVPQFARLLLLDGRGRVSAIDVDGTALPAKAPAPLAPDWEQLGIKVRKPAAPAGALPKIKATRHTRLVGVVGSFQAPTKDVALVRGVHVAAGGRRVLLDDRQTARVFDLESGELVQSVVNPGGRATLAPDGARMFTWCADRRTDAGAVLTCRDVGTGAEIWTAGVHKGPGGSPGPVVVSADGATILTGSAVKGQQLQAWSADGALKWSRALGKGDVTVEVIACSPDGLRFATGSTDERIRVWSSGRGEVEHTMTDEASTRGLHWYPDGKRLISSSTHLTAIWAIGAARPSQVLGTYERGRGAGDVALLADGIIAACVGNGQVSLWDAAGVALERLDLKVKTGAWSTAGCPDGVLVGTAAGCALRFRVGPGGA